MPYSVNDPAEEPAIIQFLKLFFSGSFFASPSLLGSFSPNKVYDSINEIYPVKIQKQHIVWANIIKKQNVVNSL